MKEPVKRDESPSHQFQNEESDTALATPLSQNTKAIQAIFSGHNLISSKSNNAFQKMSERANAYIASKTMLTRASAAMPEVLPKVSNLLLILFSSQPEYSSLAKLLLVS